VEREFLLTGIGGQGVQLAAEVLARAAVLEGRFVTSLGLYGGMMRGGTTDNTVIVADAPIAAPPIVSRAWVLVAMHDEFFAALGPKLRRGGVLFVNDATFRTDVDALCDERDATVHRVGATDRASALGHPVGGSMVMLGAVVAATGIVSIDSTIEAMRASIPSYRARHIAANETALAAGAELLPTFAHPAWTRTTTTATRR
jgi:Pyruvate/2-oxoacid:ferredoxin oxidoreductase gamma subunit